MSIDQNYSRFNPWKTLPGQTTLPDVMAPFLGQRSPLEEQALRLLLENPASLVGGVMTAGWQTHLTLLSWLAETWVTAAETTLQFQQDAWSRLHHHDLANEFLRQAMRNAYRAVEDGEQDGVPDESNW